LHIVNACFYQLFVTLYRESKLLSHIRASLYIMYLYNILIYRYHTYIFSQNEIIYMEIEMEIDMAIFNVKYCK